jgi:hypothetical protein
MRTGLLLTLLAMLPIAGGAGSRAAPRWTRFVSTAGFSVDRPAGWDTMVTSTDRLDIVSGRCRREGQVICDGEAEIVVRSEPGAGKPTRSKACWNLAEAVFESEEQFGRRTQNSVLSCTIGARRFFISERHWKDDKHAATYGRVAMRMAKSLRYPG